MARSEAAGRTSVSDALPVPSTGIGSTGMAPSGEVTLRKCEALEEMQACFALQQEVWKFADAELVPVRMFVVAAKIGGQVMGAFVKRNDKRDDNRTAATNIARNGREELIGFALALPGMRNGHSYLHSQMLAVRQQYRNGGLGRRLKLYQRDDALARGFELMEWTFDPLEIKNAYLNIEKLGAIARRYNVNQYGITSSPLQGGLPSDRLVPEWWLKSKRVETLLQTGKRPAAETLTTISVPAQIYDWKASPTTRSQAKEVQDRNREQFVRAFDDGLAGVGYERDQRGSARF